MKRLMKSILVVFVVFFSVFGLTAFGKGMMGHMFKDEGKIPSWAKDGVEDMYEQGVIEGFSEGDDKEFRGSESVTREQLAVMMHRYDKKIRMSAFVGLIHSLNKLGYIDVEDDYAAAVIMAEAGMMKLKAKPKGDGGEVIPDGDFEEAMDSIPEGYTVLSPYLGKFFLHYVGDRSTGNTVETVDQWYGPFTSGMLSIDKL